MTPTTDQPLTQARANIRATARAFVQSLPEDQQLIDNTPVDFYEQLPILPGVLTRVGNSHVGTAPEARARFGDGAPIGTSWPTTLERVAIETHSNGDQLIRTLSGWAEGRWHTCWWSLDGKYIGGHFDFPWDQRHGGPDDPPGVGAAYGIGLLGYTAQGYVGDTPESQAASLVTLTEIPRDDATAVPGYYWSGGPGSSDLRTPRFHGFSADSMDAPVPDPTNPSRLFTALNVYRLDWTKSGDGAEYQSHQSTLDAQRYPTDPRLSPGDQIHAEAVRKVSGNLYLYSSSNGGGNVLIHRWDEADRRMVPYLALYVRPETPSNLAGKPAPYDWGGALLWRDANGDGMTQAGEFTTFSAKGDGFALWSYRLDIDAQGNVLFLPFSDAGNGGKLPPILRWNPFDTSKPVPSAELLEYISLPDALADADAIESVKFNKSGDLVVIVRRATKTGYEWRLERYSAYLSATEKARKAKKPVYSVGGIATQVRRKYEWYAQYNAALDCSYEPSMGSMKGAVGALLVEGDIAFIVEAQGGGVRAYSVATGKPVGRCFSPLTPNNTLDAVGAAHAWQTASEYMVSVENFHGGPILWRIPKAALKK